VRVQVLPVIRPIIAPGGGALVLAARLHVSYYYVSRPPVVNGRRRAAQSPWHYHSTDKRVDPGGSRGVEYAVVTVHGKNQNSSTTSFRLLTVCTTMRTRDCHIPSHHACRTTIR
jgi:hypothetical protein